MTYVFLILSIDRCTNQDDNTNLYQDDGDDGMPPCPPLKPTPSMKALKKIEKRLRDAIRKTRNETIAVVLKSVLRSVEEFKMARHRNPETVGNILMLDLLYVMETMVRYQADRSGYVPKDGEPFVSLTVLMNKHMGRHRTLVKELDKLRFLQKHLDPFRHLKGNKTSARDAIREALEDQAAVRSGKNKKNDRTKWRAKKLSPEDKKAERSLVIGGMDLETFMDMLFEYFLDDLKLHLPPFEKSVSVKVRVGTDWKEGKIRKVHRKKDGEQMNRYTVIFKDGSEDPEKLKWKNIECLFKIFIAYNLHSPHT